MPRAPQFTLLLVDDEPVVLGMLRLVFADTGYRLFAAATGAEALRLTDEHRIDAALLDLQLPDTNGIDLLTRIRAKQPHSMVCIFTGKGGVPDAVEAMRHGAVDFLEKPARFETLRRRVSQLHELWVLKHPGAAADGETFAYDGLVGESSGMRTLKSLLLRVARSDATALIAGETGVGKEVVARAIHALSARRSGPFVAIDCASIAESLMESELFGHARGAYTGAEEASSGLFRAADAGTLFLDEVGELGLSMQAKLLRVLQEREVRPLGSSQSYPVDVRVLAATNRDLSIQMARDRFREDLYYRLNVVLVPVPPLRDRRSDIPTLARHFLDAGPGRRGGAAGFSSEAMAALQRYDWPGNVRELQNAVARAAALAEADEIRLEDLPEALRGASGPADGGEDTISSAERRAILQALERSGGNRQRAARILGIGVATLYRKLRRFGIDG
jgi:DNA-binding NtrC family response regulator